MLLQQAIGPSNTNKVKVETERCGMLSKVTDNLRNCRLFKELTDEHIKKIAPAFDVADYKIGDLIFRQGDPGDSVYIIERGLVNLERTVDLGSRQVNVSISFLGPHRLLGCWACLFGEIKQHTESALCQKPTRVVTAKASALKSILRGDLNITIALLIQLCYMLGDKVNGVYNAMESL